MTVVDSHCHASLVWFQPVETLLHEMDRNQVDQAVLIQMMGQTDNTYQQECVRRYPDRLASVVLVDHTRVDAADDLARWVDAGASGVRLPPEARSPGDDPFAIWRGASHLGLVVSCLGYASNFASEEFMRLVEAVPETRIVIEHLGVTGAIDQSPESAAARRCIFDLARFPNTAIKVPGLGEFARRAMPVRGSFPFEEPVPPYLDEAFEAFGARRMMWGSDFPPVAAREGYANALRLCQAYFTRRSAEDRARIFGGTASEYFPMRNRATRG